MRTLKSFSLGMLLASALAGVALGQSQQLGVPQSSSANTTALMVTADDVINHVIAREHDEVATIRQYSPIIETYIQT